MDARLLSYYERELQHLRESGQEFAREFPKVAGRLDLGGFDCQDPYVERLLEGFAYLAARVQLKIDAEFPRFTQSLFEAVYPNYLAPTPSMAIVQFEPDFAGTPAEGYTISRESVLRSQPSPHTMCEYRTAHEVALWPLRVTEAAYHTRDLATLGIEDQGGARAAIRLRLEAAEGKSLSDLTLTTLSLHLHGPGEVPFRVYEQLLAHATAVVAQPATRPAPWRRRLGAIRRVGFEDDQALMPYDPRCFQGYRLLQEYFAIPQRFLFVELTELDRALSDIEGSGVDIIILLDQENRALERALGPENFRLFCTPAINLFPRKCDRIHLSDRFSEFHVLPDRTRPTDFEVFQITDVTGIGRRSDDERKFKPIYTTKDPSGEDDVSPAYYAVSRMTRLRSQRQYPGCEVFLSIVDASAAPYHPDLQQLAVNALCTNRDLPLHMAIGGGSTDLSLDSGAPVRAVRCLVGPTMPQPSHAEGEFTWRLISHLSLNHLSLLDTSDAVGAEALRDLLRLYAREGDDSSTKAINSVVSITFAPITRRAPIPGPIAMARGIEVTLTLNETGFVGQSAFLLGAVLERFFTRYVSINGFTETVVRTVDRGEIMRWRPRIGQRQIL